MNILINNTSLPTSNICKSLGLIMDSKLRFTEHVSSKLSLAYSNLKLIYGFKNFLPQQTRKLLCDTLLLSHFNHCNSLYYPCLNAFDKYRIQKLQNACIRLIFNVQRRTRISTFLKRSNWFNMNNRFRFHMISLDYKILKSKAPNYLFNKSVSIYISII